MSTYQDYINEMYIQGYTHADDAPIFRVPENFDRYQRGNGWEAYRGANDWENGTTGVAVYLNPEGFNQDMARIWFEVQFPPHLNAYVHTATAYRNESARQVQKWGDKAAAKWIRETAKIHKASRYQVNPQVPNGRWYYKKWYECFIEALGSPVMKPYVKNFGVDRTKWVGMKRRQVNEAVAQASGIDAKYWWMDPNGELIPVGHEQHSPEARRILKQKFGVNIPYPSDVYPTMYEKGYIRVGFAGLWGQYQLEINHGQEPSITQWKALKDLAIEMGAETIKDFSKRREVRVDESRILFENFYEHKEFFVYEGTNTVTAVFEDNTRHSFKIHYRDNRNDDRQKHAAKAARTWKRLATEIRKNAGLNNAGNPVVIPWQECFSKALEDPMMKEFVDDMRATPVFECFYPKHCEPLEEQQVVREMTYDELLASTAEFQSLKDKKDGTKTAGKERIRKGQKEVNAKSLQVTSTVGPQNQEYETSLFSYKSVKRNPEDPREVKTRWQGYIRFLERYDKGAAGDVQVNCNCPDYMYVWAKSNSDAGAGETGQVLPGGFTASGPISKVSPKPMMQQQQNIFESEQPEQPAQPEQAEEPKQTPFRKSFKGGGNSNNNTYGKDIRNPDRKPGLCKHLVSLAKFLDTQSSPVAPASGEKGGSPVAPAQPKKPVNIFENMKNFASQHPQFEIPYD